mmetsp:Transcript_4553/g.7746  ORF Transcript_4553/g.7746 Transcript_4553/m.7746 type:complete len:98 (-) Transcript_4553:100-393(-)
MCNNAFCDCSSDLDPVLFGDRQAEVEVKDRTGDVLKFYEDCYLNILLKNGQVEAFSTDFLAMLERFEIEYNCGGLCETNLFYFFGTNLNGSPPEDCK